VCLIVHLSVIYYHNSIPTECRLTTDCFYICLNCWRKARNISVQNGRLMPDKLILFRMVISHRVNFCSERIITVLFAQIRKAVEGKGMLGRPELMSDTITNVRSRKITITFFTLDTARSKPRSSSHLSLFSVRSVRTFFCCFAARWRHLC